MADLRAGSARGSHLRRYAAVAFRRRRALALATVALGVGLSFTEGLGLVLLVPLMAIVGLDVSEGGIGWLAARVTAAFDAVGVRPSLVVVLVLFVVVAGARALLAGAQNVLSTRLIWDLMCDLRE